MDGPLTRGIVLRGAAAVLGAAGAMLAAGCCCATCGDGKSMTQPAEERSSESAAVESLEIAAPPVPVTQEIPDSTQSFELVRVPGGVVEVETADGAREVAVEPFMMSTREVTWDLYDVYRLRLDRTRSLEGTDADALTRPSKPYLPPDRGYGYNGYPAISISHHGAETFCEWLSLKTGHTYRLPTEAEYRLACRYGGGGALEDGELDAMAWHAGNANYTTQPVATRAANALGLHDLLGNAAEWARAAGQDENGEPRWVVMGGSFQDEAAMLGCGLAVPNSPAWNDSDPQIPKGQWWLADAGWIGFRVVREIGPPDEANAKASGAAADALERPDEDDARAGSPGNAGDEGSTTSTSNGQ